MAKKRSFGPAALYKPFGEQAAGVRSLAQFQALQDGEKEQAGLRELGLTDAEIELWRNRDVRESGGDKVRVTATFRFTCMRFSEKQKRPDLDPSHY